ncbi:MAG: ABC transporter ATP-binding protein, partial [Mesorhizobium sp.]
MFRWFETRLDPFPAEEPVEPPKTLIAFCVHYTRGAWPYIAIAVWLAGYVLLLRYFIPRLGKVGEEQANARSTMTGRVVDSYSNIQTVKLFSHARREGSFAREGMAGFLDTVYRSMRLVT